MTAAVQVTKRLIDVAGAIVGLSLTLPLYPLLYVAIYVDSPGPVFFRQRRAGRLLAADEGGQFRFAEFDMIKFRTMQVDAEKQTGVVLAKANDPRTTRLGKILRRTRLDELPQFWNVLWGDMSLVGPRPERPELIQNLAAAIPFFEERMRNVKPGITGLAQVSLSYSGRATDKSTIKQYEHTLTNPFQLPDAEESMADGMRLKLLYDLAYVAALEEFSTFLKMELSIIFRTPLVMLGGSGY